jgi:hypothetical protein
VLDRVLAIVSGDTGRATKQLKPHRNFYSKPRNGHSITRATTYADVWLGLGHYIHRSTSQVAVDDPQETLHRIQEWHFFPRKWLPLVGFQLRTIKISGNWQYFFSPIRVVPIESPIFKACWKGDIPEMRRLISQGQASVHDTTPAGRTLLHVSGSASPD